MTYTTITDVTAAIVDAEPGFATELTEDELRDIVNANRIGRYEDITAAEFEAMLEAAYVATGVDAEQAARIVR